MKGHTRKRGKTWSYIIDIGKIDGKRKQKEKGGFRTKRDAEKALIATLSELQTTGQIFDFKKITFQELFNEFIKYECINKRPSTIKKYNSLYENHFKPLIGYKYIHSIKVEDLEEYIIKLKENYSPSYIKNIISVLKAIFNYSVRKKYLKENPIKELKSPSIPAKGLKVYSKSEINKLLNRLKSTNLYPPFFVGLHTGMRAGEVYALRWSDIDFENNKIFINKQLQFENNKWCFTPTKTNSGTRKIDMQPVLKEFLIKLKKTQDLKKAELGKLYFTNKIFETRENNNKGKTIDIDDMIMVKSNGKMLNTYSHKYITKIAKEELNINFKFHNLRDTHASMLLAEGLSIVYIQKRLGHSRPSITLDVYSDLLPDDIISLNKLENAMSNI